VKNLTVSAGFEPANLGTKGQRANPWTTEAAKLYLLRNYLLEYCRNKVDSEKDVYTHPNNFSLSLSLYDGTQSY
jgi:hypothetical protein